jgi:hypothetical protein
MKAGRFTLTFLSPIATSAWFDRLCGVTPAAVRTIFAAAAVAAACAAVGPPPAAAASWLACTTWSRGIEPGPSRPRF